MVNDSKLMQRASVRLENQLGQVEIIIIKFQYYFENHRLSEELQKYKKELENMKA